MKIHIVYEDNNLVIINKPSGLLSVPGRIINECATLQLQQTHPTALAVHRLDMDTSGLMVFALDPDTHRYLNQQFSDRLVSKGYHAWVHNTPTAQSGMIDWPLICDWPNRPRQKVDFNFGKPALTHWKLVKQNQGFSFLALTPETGRSHQLRVHLASLGHAIVGDSLYAPDNTFNFANRLMLHASYLAFRHPISGKLQRFLAKPNSEADFKLLSLTE